MAPQDRDYYRSLSSAGLLNLAREQGINPEMAVVLAENLAARTPSPHQRGHFRFNQGSMK